MVVELNNKNLSLLNNSFIDKDDVLKELSNNPFAKYLLYLEQDRVIGYIYYSDIYDRCEINQIEVILEKRGCGIATKLMDTLISNVSKTISLEVRVDNFIAIKLYEKFDFSKKTIRKGYYNGIDGILMVKE